MLTELGFIIIRTTQVVVPRSADKKNVSWVTSTGRHLVKGVTRVNFNWNSFLNNTKTNWKKIGRTAKYFPPLFTLKEGGRGLVTLLPQSKDFPSKYFPSWQICDTSLTSDHGPVLTSFLGIGRATGEPLAWSSLYHHGPSGTVGLSRLEFCPPAVNKNVCICRFDTYWEKWYHVITGNRERFRFETTWVKWFSVITVNEDIQYTQYCTTICLSVGKE